MADYGDRHFCNGEILSRLYVSKLDILTTYYVNFLSSSLYLLGESPRAYSLVVTQAAIYSRKLILKIQETNN